VVGSLEGIETMPVNTRQAMYAERLDEWKRCRDAVAGSDAVKSAGTAYLPRLGGQGIVQHSIPGLGVWAVDEYEAYKRRANWFNASKAALKEIQGALFRVLPVWEVPEVMRAHLDDITMTGEAANSFAQRLASEVITVGFAGVLVDLPTNATALRPYWTSYRAEQILRAMMVNLDGIWVLGQVVLEEVTTEPGEDEFDDEEVTRWRVLQLDDQGLLIHRLFATVEGQSRPVEIEQLQPSIRGQRFREIPFVFFGPSALLSTPEVSPILDLVDINYSHYRTSADLEEGLHKLAVPTPYAAGIDDIDQELRLGANVAYTSTNPGFKIAFAEFSGAGLGELRTALEHKELQMDAIRARLMSRQKGGVESAEAIRLRTAGEQNVLMSLSSTLSQGLSRLLSFHASWMGARQVTATCAVNSDFIDRGWTPAEQAEHRADLQAGIIAWSTYYYLRAKGELTRPDVTAEEEMAEIEAERPLAGEPALEIPPEEPEPEEPETEEAA
jgi:hypothetical protein